MIVPHAEIREQVFALYEAGGFPKGTSTGWPSVDALYTVGIGQWTVLTGVPNSGKSEWLDALLVNLAKQENWKFYIYSPENWPLAFHHAKIIEKYVGKPFNPGPNERLDVEELDAAEEWMRYKFFFGKPTRPNLLDILDEAEKLSAGAETWKVGVIVDPWNQLEHHCLPGQTMTHYISETLSGVTDRVRDYNMHLWLVAHPAKLRKDRDGKYPVPTPHDISDSAHFWNKSDACITIARDLIEGSQDVDVHVQKVRWKHIGRIGFTTLKYDRITGRYHEPPRKLAPVFRQYKDG